MFSIKSFVTSYEIKKSKTDHNVPVVNGIHLHSMYDPLKEAYKLISRYEEKLKSNPKALVLGMGLSYHIKILKNILKKNHGKKAKIVVIDPNKDVFDDYLKSSKTEDVSYLITDKIDDLYSNKNFIDFLVESPTIIQHPASFNLYLSFYKSFLSYQSPTSLHEYIENIENKNMKEHLQTNLSYNSGITFHQYIESLRQSRRGLKKYDYILIALHEMNKKCSFKKVAK